MHPQALTHHQMGLQFHQAGDLLPAVREYLRALAIDPTLELTRFNLAALYLRLGEQEKAISQYDKLLELNPIHGKAYFNLGTLYSSLGRTSQAIEAFEKLLALEPENGPALLNLGWLYRRQGDPERAIETIEAAHRLEPHNPKVRIQLGQLYLEGDRHDEARSLMEGVLKLEPQNVPARVILADCAWMDGLAGEALRLAREALEIDPTDERARELCSWCYRMQADQAREAGKAEVYAQNLEGLLWLEPGDEEILSELKRIYQHLGDLFKLVRVLDAMLKVRFDLQTAYLLGESLLKCGQRAEAKAVFARLAEGEKPDRAALDRLFWLAREDEEPLESLAAIATRVVQVDPCHTEALLCLAEEAFKRGDARTVVHWVEAILALEPSPRAIELHTMGYRALAKGAQSAQRTQDALDAWKSLLRYKPDDPEGLAQAGRLLYSGGRDAEAARVLKRLLTLNPRDTETAYLLALCYRRMNVPEGARAILEAILERHSHIPALVALAELDPARKREYLLKGLEWDSRSPLVLTALGRLEIEEKNPLKAWGHAQVALEAERSPETVLLGKDCLRILIRDAMQNLGLALQLAVRLVELDSNDPRSLRLLGRVCRRKGVTAKAAEAFAAILSLDPDDVGAIHGLYRAYRLMNLPTQAKAVLHGSLKRKKRVRVLFLLIEACQEEGNPFGTLEYAEELLHLRPGHPLATRLAVQCCRQMAMHALERKDLPISAYYWEQLLGFSPDDLEAVRYLATIYLRAKDYRQALPVFERFHRLDPENMSALVNLGWLYQQLGQSDQAIPCYQEALTRQPDPKLMLLMAQLYRQQGRFREAREVLKSRLLLDPNHVPSHVALAELAWELGDLSDCLLHVREVLARNPKDKDGRSLGIACLRELARRTPLPGKIEYLEDLLELQPEEPLLLEQLGTLHREQGNRAKAVSAYERLVQLTPRNRRTLFLLGETLAWAGEGARAREVLEALDRAEPHLAALEALTTLAEGEEAILLLRRLLRFAPDHIPGLLRLAKLLPPAEALPVLAHLRELSPEDCGIRDLSIRTFEECARQGEGIEEERALRELLNVAPDHVPALTRVSHLLALRSIQEAEPYLERLVSLAPEPDSVRMLARYRLKKGRLEEAYRLFEQLSDAPSRRTLAEIDWKRGDLASAEVHYRQVLEIEPSEEDARSLGRVLLEAGRYPAARKVFSDLVRENPNGVPDFLALAEIALLADDPWDARKQAREALARQPEERDGQKLLVQALDRLAHREGDPAQRARFLEELQSLRPERRLLEEIGQAYLEAGLPAKAVRAYETLLEQDPLSNRIPFLLGEALAKAGEKEKAEEAFLMLGEHRAALEARIALHEGEEAILLIRQLLALVPEHLPALVKLAQLLEPDEALPILARLRELAPEDSGIRDLSVYTFERLAREYRDTPEEEGLLRELLSIHPIYRPAVHRLSRLLLESGAAAEAESLLKRLQAKLPNEDTLVQLALCWLAMGKRREAFEQLLSLTTHPQAAMALADLAKEEDDLLEAEKRYLRALTLDPKDPEIREALAKVYLEQGRFREIVDLLAGIETPGCRLLMGEALRALARTEESEERWRTLLRILPDDREARLALGRILFRQERFEEYLENLREIEKNEKNEKSEEPLCRAIALHRTGRWEEARGCYEAILADEGEENSEKRLDVRLLLTELLVDLGEDLKLLKLPKLPKQLEDREKELALALFRKLARRSPRTRRNWHRILDLAPEDSEAQRSLAEVYLASGDFSEAKALLDSLNERLGGAEIRHLLAQALVGLDRRAEAKQLLAQARSHVPSQFSLAVLHDEDDEPEAVTRYQRVLVLDPEHAEALSALGRISFAQERWEDALGYLDKLMRLAKPGKNPRAEATMVECHRQLAEEAEDPAAREAHLRALLELAPKDRDGRRKLGAHLHARGDFEEALIFLDPVRQGALIADSHLRLGRVEEAKDIYEGLLAKNPGDKGVALALAEIFYDEGNPKRALDMAERALALDRGDARAKNLALKFMEDVVHHARKTNDLTAAVRTLEKLRSLAPDRRVFRHLGNTYTELELYEKALSCFNALLEIDPNDRDIAFLVGETLLKSGEKKRAREVFTEIVQGNPHHLPAQMALADLCWESGEDARAVEHLEKVLSRKPNHRDAIDLAIRSYRELAHQAYASANLAEAMGHWERINKLDPEDIEALFELGRIYSECGKPEKALGKLRRILEKDWDEDTAFLLALCLRKTNGEREARGLLERLAPQRFDALAELSRMATDLDEEERFLNELLERRPNHLESRRRLARLLLDTERPQEALKLLEGAPDSRDLVLEASRRLGREGDLAAWAQLLRVEPEDEEALQALIEARLAAGEDREAASLLERLCRIEDDPLLLQTLGECWLRLQEWEKAVSVFSSAPSNHLPCKFGLARARWETGRVLEAWRLLDEILAKRPNYPEARELASACLAQLTEDAFELGETEAATLFLEKHLLLREDRALRLRLARTYESSEPAQALSEYRSMVERDPADFDASFGLGRLLFEGGELPGAKLELDRLLVLAPDHVPALQLMARVEPGEARDCHLQVLEADPENVDSLLFLARADFEAEDWEGARAFTAVLDAVGHPEGRALHGAVIRKLALLAVARDDLDAAVSLCRSIPEDRKAQRLLARLLARQGRFEALPAYRSVLAQDKEDWESAVQLAALLIDGGTFHEARALLEGVLAHVPHSQAYALLASIVAEPGWAILLAKRALERRNHPQARRILVEKARQLAEEGDWERWADVLAWAPHDRQALFMQGGALLDEAPAETVALLARVRPKNQETALLLAEGYRLLGMPEEARKWVQKALGTVGGQLILAQLDGEDLEALLAHDPEDAVSRILVGKTWFERGAVERALEYFEGDKKVEHPLARQKAIAVYRQMAEAGLAEAWDRVLALVPEHAEALAAKAMLGFSQDDAAAEEWANRSLVRKPDPELAASLASWLLARGKEGAALAWFDRALTWEPLHIPTLLALAAFHQGKDEGKWREMLERLAKADHLPSLLTLAESDPPREAWLRVEQLLSTDPSLEEAHALAIRLARELAGDPVLERIGRTPDPTPSRSALEACQALAVGLLELNLRDTALPLFEQIVERDPRFVPALLQLAQSHEGEISKGLYRHILSLGSQREASFASFGLCEMAIQEGDLAEAWRVLEPALEESSLDALDRLDERYPEAQPVVRKALLHLAERSEPPLAMLLYQRVVEQEPDADTLRKLARLLLDGEDELEAIKVLQEVLKLEPRDLETLTELTELLIQREDWHLAQALLRRFLGEEEVPSVLALLLRVESGAGNDQAAMEGARRLLELKPKHKEARRILIDSCRKLARTAQDRALWEELLEFEPKDREALLALGSLLLEQAPEEAIPPLERLTKLNPPDPEGMLLLAQCKLALGREGEAKKLASKALKREPDSLGAKIILAQIARNSGEEAEADRLLSEVEAASPTDANNLVTLGKLALDNGDSEKALERFEEALSAAPEHPTALRMAIDCHRLFALGDEEAGQKHWERILSLSPNDPEALAELARSALSRGESRGEELARRYLAMRADADLAFLFSETLMQQGREAEAVDWLDRINGWDDSHVPTLLALADRHWREGKTEKARTFFERVVECDPFNVPSHLSLGEMALQEDDLGVALLEIERVLECSPDEESALMLAIQISSRLASAAREAGDLRGETEHLKRIVELDVQEIDARYRLVEIYLETERWAEAAELCHEMIELGETRPLVFSQWGDALEKLGRSAEAAIAYERVLEGDPHHVPTLEKLAEATWRSLDFDRAWELVETLLSLEPGNLRGKELRSLVARELGNSAYRMANYSDAIAWWQVCEGPEKNENAEDPALIRQIAQAYLKLGDLPSASAIYQQLYRQDPDDIETICLLADLYRQQGNFHQAEKSLKQVLKQNRRHADSLLTLARIAQQKGDPAETMNRAFDLLDVEPQSTDALEILAWAHQQLLEVKAAIDVYQQISQLKPQDPEPQHQLAILYRDTGQFEHARKAITVALYHSPKNPAYLNTLGTIYSLQGQWDEAEASFQQALKLDPDFGEAYANLGFSLMQSGAKAKARPYLERANSLLAEDSELALSIQCMLDLF